MATYEKEEILLKQIKESPLCSQRDLGRQLGVCTKTIKDNVDGLEKKGLVRVFDYGNVYGYAV